MRLLRNHPVSLLVVGAVAAAFFFAPLAAFLVGERGHPIENRPAVQFPDFSSERFNAFSTFNQWALDRLPLRPEAVKARVKLTRRLFGELPEVLTPGGPAGAGQLGDLTDGAPSANADLSRAEQVLLGQQNWLFLGEEFVNACKPEMSIGQVVAGMKRLSRIIRASGRRLVLTIAPDKSTLEQAYLPSDLPERGCALPEKQARLAALAKLPPAVGYLDLHGVLARQQARTGPIYLPEDTHWNELGGKLYVSSVMRRLDPRVLERTTWAREGEVPYVGDLAAKAGDPITRKQPGYVLRRPGVRTRLVGQHTIGPGYTIFREQSSSTPVGAPLYGPRTLYYGDSFTEKEVQDIYPFFRDVLRFPELARAAVGGFEPAARAEFVRDVKDSQTIVIEVAERIFWGRRPGSVVSPQLLDQLARGLGVDA
jgi:hypothetical protein